MWWDSRLSAKSRALLLTFLLCAIGSVSVGFYFRAHYFITLLPALALLSGVAFSRSLSLLQQDTSIELFLVIAVLVLGGVACGASLVGNSGVWFNESPKEAVEDIYHSTLFCDTREAANYVRLNSAPGAKIAVLGSEPEVYFYARRRSTTGFIYAYPFLEQHEHAEQMQEQAIAEIERNRPDLIVFVSDPTSFRPVEGAAHRIFDWWPKYWQANLDLVMTVNTREVGQLPETNGDARPSKSFIGIFKAKAMN